MNKRKQFLALYLASIGAFGALASVSAATLPAGTSTKVRDQALTAIKQAITNGDYQAFLAATKNSRAGMSTITEVQFNAMVAANKLRAAGDIAGAKKLLSDAGIKPPMLGIMGKYSDRGIKKGMANLTDNQKATLKQAQDLMKAGKTAEAETLLINAGIKMPNSKSHTSENSKMKKFFGLHKKASKTSTSTTTQ